MKNTLLFIIALFSFSALNAQTSGMKFEHDKSFQQLVDQAKNENKYIFIDCYASWCGPCKWMVKYIFPVQEVGEYFNAHYINAKFDMEKGEGLELAKKFDVKSYPTYLILNSNGEVVHRGLGSMEKSDFLALGEAGINPEKQFVSLKNKYMSGNRDAAFLHTFLIAAFNAQDSLYNPVMTAYLEQQPNLLDTANLQLIAAYTQSVHDAGFTYLMKYPEAFKKQMGESKYTSLIEEFVYNEGRRKAKTGNGSVDFKNYVAQFFPQKADELTMEFEVNTLKRAGNWKAYYPKAKQFVQQYAWNDYDRLNSIAWNIYENMKDKKALQDALKWALRSVELKNEADNNDTAGRLYYTVGNKAKAKTHMQTAISLAKTAGEDTSDMENFLKKVK